jgi:hypothetical protein
MTKTIIYWPSRCYFGHLKNDHTRNSAFIAIEGWDFPEAPYVASLASLQ